MRELQTARGTSLTQEGAGPGQETGSAAAAPILAGQHGLTGQDGTTGQDGLNARPGGAGKPKVGVLLAVAVTVLAADIITKSIVVATLSGRPPIRLLGGFLTLTLSRNPGAAFSIGQSLTIVFTAIAASVIVFILRTSRRIYSVRWAISLGLLLGGATGNLTDRLFRYPGPLRGYVVDWIMLPHWPIFNLADSSIVCGGVLAVLLATLGLRIDGSKASQQAPPGAAPGGAG